MTGQSSLTTLCDLSLPVFPSLPISPSYACQSFSLCVALSLLTEWLPEYRRGLAGSWRLNLRSLTAHKTQLRTRIILEVDYGLIRPLALWREIERLATRERPQSTLPPPLSPVPACADKVWR